jgi:ankyrin repeat protein
MYSHTVTIESILHTTCSVVLTLSISNSYAWLNHYTSTPNILFARICPLYSVVRLLTLLTLYLYRCTAMTSLTALHLAACAASRLPVLLALLAYPVVVDARDTAGFTPLHIAVQSALPETVLALLQSSAFPDAETLDGDNCAHLAARADSAACLGYLSEYRVNVGRRNWQVSALQHSALYTRVHSIRSVISVVALLAR